jgi:zinc protease
MIHEQSEDVPLVEIRHILRSGAAMEPAEQAGVGRLALRLLRRGAAGKDRRAVDEALDRIAAVVSTQATPDFFALHFRVLRKYLDRATALFAEVLHQPTLDADELERLKRETMAEIVSSRDDDRHLASRALRLKVYENHRYAVTPRGTLTTIPTITVDQVKAFLAEHLVADNILVGAAGHVSPEELNGIVGTTVGALPRDGNVPVFDLAPAEPHRGIRVVLVDKPERTQTQIFVGHLGPSVQHPDDLALRVALTAFGGTFTSRLMQEVRVARGWSYGAYASLGRGRLPEITNMWAFPALKDATPCLQLLLKLYGELKREGPPAEDILFARDYLARGLALQRDTASARLTLRLRQELLGLANDYYDTYAERVRQISPDQAKAAVATHLDDQNLVIAIACTAKDLLQPLRDALGAEAQIEVIPYDSPLL